MPQSDFVSVTIVTYNSGRFIKRCLESVLAQRYQHKEIVVIDNASDDASRPHRIRPSQSPRANGS